MSVDLERELLTEITNAAEQYLELTTSQMRDANAVTKARTALVTATHRCTSHLRERTSS